MTTTLTSSVRAADGNEIPFEWVYEEAPQCEWMRDRAHWPDPMTPMELWLWKRGPGGADRAWAEIDMVPPAAFQRFQMVGPFLYVRTTMQPMEQMTRIIPRYVAVSKEYGGPLSFWKTYCEPRIKNACDDIAATQPGADLQAAAELWFYGFHQTFTSLALLFIPNMRLTAMLTEHVGEDVEILGFEVTQGGDNATQDIDAEIWALAGLARETAAVSRIVQSGRSDALDELRREPEAAPFIAAFDALIAQHGRRSQAWMFMTPTWGEDPASALALVRAQLGAKAVSPDELRALTARRRRESTERVLASIPADKHDEFREIVSELDGYVNVREGRAYWQLVICGEMRRLVLRVGDELVRAGRIEQAGDALFLTPDDLQIDPSSDLRALVATNRDAWKRDCALELPFTIGTPGDASKLAETMRAELRGAPASRGLATGTARVLHTPDEGHRLQKGDILVCVMTTPAWTPLFAIAGGIITETGGALSHPAITAREYGIPAVVALQKATTTIADGSTVTIDGAKGKVIVSG